MAKDKTTLRFWLRTDRPNKDGSAPIHLYYQIQGQKSIYAVPAVRLFPINWDLDNQLAIHVSSKLVMQKNKTLPELSKKIRSCPNERERQKIQATFHSIQNGLKNIHSLPGFSDITEINTKIQEVVSDIRDIETRFKLDKIAFSTHMVIEALKEMKKPETKKELPQVVGTGIVDFISRFSKETTAHKKGTIKAYTGLNNHLARYQREKNQRLTFENIDVPTMKSIQNFMLEKYGFITKKGNKIIVQLNNITVAKLLSTLKTMIKKAEDEYDIAVNPKYKKFKNPHPRKDGDIEVIALTEEELQSLYHLDLPNKALDEARDIFCFSCATGLRYGDMAEFRRHHITKDNRIVMPSSDKNSKGIDIPFIPMSYEILKKYEHCPYPLPVTPKLKLISNQRLNDHIKKIGELAKINTEIEIVREIGIKKIKETLQKYELISIHTGRKTFFTLSLERGIPLQDVMSMTTHSSYKAAKRYINITKDRKKSVMETAYGAVPETKFVRKVG